MSLKAQIERDIDAVFMNLNDFADWHLIDGKKVKCVIEEGSAPSGTPAIGTFGQTITVCVELSLLPGRPALGAPMRVDKKGWTVAEVSEEFGLLTIKLEANRT